MVQGLAHSWHNNGGLCTNTGGALVTDNGLFSGVNDLTHELGHLIFSARHDKDLMNEGCSGADGFIMSDRADPLSKWAKRNMHKWSKCSKAAYKKNIIQDKANCLHNVPLHSNYDLSDVENLLKPPYIPPLSYQCADVPPASEDFMHWSVLLGRSLTGQNLPGKLDVRFT